MLQKWFDSLNKIQKIIVWVTIIIIAVVVLFTNANPRFYISIYQKVIPIILISALLVLTFKNPVKIKLQYKKIDSKFWIILLGVIITIELCILCTGLLIKNESTPVVKKRSLDEIFKAHIAK